MQSTSVPSVVMTGLAAFALAGGACGLGAKSEAGETTAVVRAALTSTFPLPVPVGLNPGDIVLGANRSVSVNDRASVFGTTPLGAFPSGGIAAFGSGSDLLNIGNSASAGRIWATTPLLLRNNAEIIFYKTSGAVQQQTGVVFGDPSENRSNATIRKDPIWTVAISAPTSGAGINVFGGQTRTLDLGSYGPTTVFSGGTLRLTGGTYGFVSLDLEPGAIVQLDDPGQTTVGVNTTVILRARLGGAGFVFGYLGTQAVHVEAPFTGDLFLAQAADIEIKSDSTGHFFGNHVTVFEQVHVSGGPLGAHAQTLVRPIESLQLLGQLDPSAGAAEIATAVLPAGGACAQPTAFVSYGNAALLQVPGFGSATATNLAAFPAPAPQPTSCIETVLPGVPRIPGADTHLWEILSPGIPSYADVVGFTDNAVTRVGDGTVVMVGATARLCVDPAAGVKQGPDCPASPPQEGATCHPGTTTGACVYDVMPGTQCSCVPTGAPEPEAGIFRCGTLLRLEEDAFGVRVSHDCGATWTATAVDPFAMGITGPARDIDRWETYYDPFDSKLYISSTTRVGPGDDTNTRLVVLTTPAFGLTNANQLRFRVLKDQVFDGFPMVISTALDQTALLPSGTGRSVLFATFRCKGPDPVFDVDTPFSTPPKELSLATMADPSTQCQEVVKTTGGRMPFSGHHAGPSIVGTASSPPRFYVAYSGISKSGFEIVNVYAITLRSANGYQAPPDVTRVLVVDRSANGQDAIWPQLIRADGAGGADLTLDTPVVLRYALVGGDTVTEQAVALYSGLAGPAQSLTTWSIAATYSKSAAKCAASTQDKDNCFAGDYRYGSFYRKTSNGRLDFFVPWSGQATKAGSGGTTPPGVFTTAATLTIIP